MHLRHHCHLKGAALRLFDFRPLFCVAHALRSTDKGEQVVTHPSPSGIPFVIYKVPVIVKVVPVIEADPREKTDQGLARFKRRYPSVISALPKISVSG